MRSGKPAGPSAAFCEVGFCECEVRLKLGNDVEEPTNARRLANSALRIDLAFLKATHDRLKMPIRRIDAGASTAHPKSACKNCTGSRKAESLFGHSDGIVEVPRSYKKIMRYRPHPIREVSVRNR